MITIAYGGCFFIGEGGVVFIIQSLGIGISVGIGILLFCAFIATVIVCSLIGLLMIMSNILEQIDQHHKHHGG